MRNERANSLNAHRTTGQEEWLRKRVKMSETHALVVAHKTHSSCSCYAEREVARCCCFSFLDCTLLPVPSYICRLPRRRRRCVHLFPVHYQFGIIWCALERVPAHTHSPSFSIRWWWCMRGRADIRTKCQFSLSHSRSLSQTNEHTYTSTKQ